MNRKESLERTHPELILEWDQEENGKVQPTMFTAGSQAKVWWKCNSCGYKWMASINSRTRGTGCPECGKKKMGESHRKTVLAGGERSLAVVDPLLALEWNYEKNPISPHELTANTNYKAWWTCPDCGYVYQSAVSNRHKNSSGCPVCANQVLCSGINDLKTLYPEIASEWSAKNEDAPDKVLAGGHTKHFFQCHRCGYIWSASIASRIRGTGCPNCSFTLHTSIPEQVIFLCLKTVWPSIRNSYKPRWLQGREVDIYIPHLKVGIEYDGGGWHQDIKRDIDKTKMMHEHGIELIRIRESKCPKVADNSIQITLRDNARNYYGIQKAIEELCDVLNERFDANIELQCNVKDVYAEVVEKFRNKILDVSFASEYPNLMSEWNYEKNKGLDAHNISPKSSIKIWWRCKDCGYEWQSTPERRTRAGCPYCANEVVWAGHNDMATIRPDILEEWDYENNQIKPQEVTASSHKKIAWSCKKCGYKWSSPLYSKAAGHGCPKCARETVAKKQSKRVKNIETGKIYDSVKEASQETGIGESNITRVCRGEGKKAGGYHWIYY